MDSRERLVVEVRASPGSRARAIRFTTGATHTFFLTRGIRGISDCTRVTQKVSRAQIAPITHRIAARVGTEIPETRNLPTRFVSLPPKIQKQYRELEREYVVLSEKKLDEGLLKVEAEHCGVLYAKLRQMAQGVLYETTKKGKKVIRTPEWLAAAKHDELGSLVSELQGTQALIVFHFKAQLERLRKQFPDIKTLGGQRARTTTLSPRGTLASSNYSPYSHRAPDTA